MLDFFTSSSVQASPVLATEIVLRLVGACLFGFLVAVAYRLHRHPTPFEPTFPLTLVLLSILIAMVMQVIDDQVARAFSLVGALSIVRFRTVLDDTQDIAFVIFAVVVGMASGTGAIGVAIIGSIVMFGTLGLSRLPFFGRSESPIEVEPQDANLTIRTALGTDYQQTVIPFLDTNLSSYRLLSAETSRGGSVREWSYSVRFRQDTPASKLLEDCSKVEGIQNVEIKILNKNG